MAPGIVESKKAVSILIWSAIIHAFYVLPFVRTDTVKNSNIYRGLISGSLLLLYPLSGWLADVYTTRYKAMFASLLSVILGTVLSIVFSFTVHEVILLGFAIVRVGYWMFEVNAIMLGFEHLQAYSIENQRVFIYWFYWTLEIGHFVYGLCVCVSAESQGAITGSLITSAVLGSLQVVAMVTMVILLLLWRHWLVGSKVGYHPLGTILSITRQALHRPIGLDKLTFSKGGLYSRAIIEEARTFFYIIFIICPISIVYYTDEIFSVATQFRPNNRNISEGFQQCLLTEVPNWMRSAIAVLFLPIYIIILTPIITKITHYTWLLFRMGVGLALAFLAVFSLFGMELKISLQKLENDTDLYGHSIACVENGGGVSYYWLIIPELLNGFSVVIVFSTVLEFICAQSTSGVKGFLIAIWFSLTGLNKIVVTIQEIWHLDCNIYYYIGKVLVVAGFTCLFLYALRLYSRRNQESDLTESNDGCSNSNYSSIEKDSGSYDVTNSALANYIPT